MSTPPGTNRQLSRLKMLCPACGRKQLKRLEPSLVTPELPPGWCWSECAKCEYHQPMETRYYYEALNSKDPVAPPRVRWPAPAPPAPASPPPHPTQTSP